MASVDRALLILILLTATDLALLGQVRGQGSDERQEAHFLAEPTASLNTCPSPPCVFSPMLASEGGGEVTDTPIVANPLNSQNLLLASVDVNCPRFSTSGFHISTDGGSTWSRYCMPVLLNFKGRVFYPGGQPMVAYDLNGTAYIADQYGDSEGLGYGLVGIQKSTDGVHWSPVMALSGAGLGSANYSWMAVDTNASSPYVNSLYVSTFVIYGPLFDSQLVVSHSNDAGETWTAVPLGPKDANDLFTHLSVGRDGTVYLTWQYCPGISNCENGIDYMLFSKSADGGNTWSGPVLMATVTSNRALGQCQCGISSLPNTDEIRVYNYPVIGTDNSSGPYAGNLYVVMQTWTGTNLRVLVVRSSDGGTTWSKPVLVAPASDTYDQFFPWLSVSATGLVGVSWLDRRNDPANVDYQAFAAISADGGQSFQPNIQLTENFSNPNNNGYPDNRWMGDYSGNTWDGEGNFIAAWMDSSNGVDMQEVVGGIRLK